MEQKPDPQVIEFTKSISINYEDAEQFELAWELLIAKFKIPDKDQAPLFHILRSFFTTIEEDFLTIYELNNSIEAISFFLNYREAMDKITVKYNGSTSKIDDFMKLTVIASNQPITFNYPGITPYGVELLYKHLRGFDRFLQIPLDPYPELPTLLVLTEIQNSLKHDYSFKHQQWLIYTIEQLKGYISNNLASILSRKVNLFIFELLYLFNIIKYAGKVNEKESPEFDIEDKTGADKFSSVGIGWTDSQKTKFLTTVIVNAIKREDD